MHGGRLGSVREDVAKFTSSIKDDARLLNAVVAINKAHVVMLAEQKIITREDAQALLSALVDAEYLKLDSSMEDVHMAVEEAVHKEAGTEAGGNLHNAKSRNDQVATAIRIELRNQLLTLMRSVAHVQEHMAEVAERTPQNRDSGIHAPTALPSPSRLPIIYLLIWMRCQRDMERSKRLHAG